MEVKKIVINKCDNCDADLAPYVISTENNSLDLCKSCLTILKEKLEKVR